MAQAKVTPKVEINAKKETHGAEQAMELLASVSQLYAARGKKVVHVDLRKDELSTAELQKLILGPTGNLRAPTLRKGKTLMVGYHEETYDKLFG